MEAVKVLAVKVLGADEAVEVPVMVAVPEVQVEAEVVMGTRLLEMVAWAVVTVAEAEVMVAKARTEVVMMVLWGEGSLNPEPPLNPSTQSSGY